MTTIFIKRSILDILKGSEYASADHIRTFDLETVSNKYFNLIRGIPL